MGRDVLPLNTLPILVSSIRAFSAFQCFATIQNPSCSESFSHITLSHAHSLAMKIEY